MQLMFRAYSHAVFGAGIAVMVATSAASAMPSPLWSGIEQIRTSCAVKNAAPAKEVAICKQFERAVSERSPYAVNGATAKLTDLLVRFESNLAANGRVSGQIIASRFTAHSDGDESARQMPISFITNPATAAPNPAISAALDHLLPWRQRTFVRQHGRAN